VIAPLPRELPLEFAKSTRKGLPRAYLARGRRLGLGPLADCDRWYQSFNPSMGERIKGKVMTFQPNLRAGPPIRALLLKKDLPS